MASHGVVSRASENATAVDPKGACEKIGMHPLPVRRWIRCARLRVGRHHEIETKDLRDLEDESLPMAKFPEE